MADYQPYDPGNVPQQQPVYEQQPYQQQPYQQPTGRGWNAAYNQPQPQQPVQQPQQQNSWQGGYTVNQWAGQGYAPVHENMLGKQEKPHQRVDRGTLLKLIAAAAAIIVAVVLVVGLMVRKNQTEALRAAVHA